ncbi:MULTISPECIES: UdgX family uracil-DNA binding protein [Nitrospirillum]|uniref:Type-4 uracil-DNA glycosylase n=1 Tax=Nitrospirillum amazonense TaxID=28077 RepID=A0A560EUR7_9PROT|nr:UdgX family uracil-DNA binding protein [Nitrospirillum amazonense]MEC4589946.1 UdgX family uracil-DNA binding protein [Nitrospirillum amazonense]TWB13123.1 DNA polymerase [Nitrospirillum amazonense]
MDRDLAGLAASAADCRRCDLYRDATQVVFGEGPVDARLVLVGEQPGDQEDKAGRPFVGPAGRILDEALAAAGLERDDLFVTNAVKHFKHEMRGKRRMHQRPNQGEVEACRWWLDREVALVQPTVIVALGATAARSLMGRTVALVREGGKPLAWADGRPGIATYHPSAVLRAWDDAARARTYDALVAALRQARDMAGDNANKNIIKTGI